MAANVPMPLSDPIARPRNRALAQGKRDASEGTLTDVWIPYFQSQNSIVATALRQAAVPVELSDQSASIGVTAIPADSLAPGLYRVTWYARITRAATTSSSLVVTFSWTDGGIACSTSSAALTGNTTSTSGTGSALMNIDQASPVSYSTTYGSVGATTMQHSLAIVLETINT